MIDLFYRLENSCRWILCV